MRFDVVIIGGGLAGLAAGLRLQGQGLACALINAGQSAMHFSSGAFDFLNFMPDGAPVAKPVEALEQLAALEPEHPYSRMGAERTIELALAAEALLAEWGAPMTGSLARGNHCRITPLGGLHPAWLSSPDLLTSEWGENLPWKKILLVNIEGFLDFYPEIMAEQLSALGVASEFLYLTTPELEILRQNPSEFRSVNIARVLDQPDNLAAFAARLGGPAASCDALLMPACIGLNDFALLEKVRRAAGKPVRLAPTLPPSLLGARLSRQLASRFSALGGLYMPGDRAVGYALQKGRIARVFTQNHEDIPLEAESFILATGGFFSQGLRSDAQVVREPVFNLDLFEIPQDRDDWTAQSVFAPQPYARFGVRSDAAMRVYMGGRPAPNLYAAGMVLGGYDAVRLGCGAGVALTTALAAAESILQGRAG